MFVQSFKVYQVSIQGGNQGRSHYSHFIDEEMRFIQNFLFQIPRQSYNTTISQYYTSWALRYCCYYYSYHSKPEGICLNFPPT